MIPDIVFGLFFQFIFSDNGIGELVELVLIKDGIW